jgi:protein-S-isoprenylcysteine O-methyltransferase Ste14
MRHLLAIILLPGMVLLVIPWIILKSSGSAHIGWTIPPPWSFIPVGLGLLLIGLGLAILLTTIRYFARIGRGTLAPWDPTKKLVIAGPYRYFRNPMISGVLCVLLGETLFFGSLALFLWFAFFLVINVVYMPLSEEPGLEKRFGDEYQTYKQNVPRWIPRHTPWEGTTQDTERF